jgi:hypothetical protein
MPSKGSDPFSDRLLEKYHVRILLQSAARTTRRTANLEPNRRRSVEMAKPAQLNHSFHGLGF